MSGTRAAKESSASMVFDIPPGKREVEAGAGRHIARAVERAVCCGGREEGQRRLRAGQNRPEWNLVLASTTGSQTGLCCKPFISAITGAINQHLGTPEHLISGAMKVKRSELKVDVLRFGLTRAPRSEHTCGSFKGLTAN